MDSLFTYYSNRNYKFCQLAGCFLAIFFYGNEYLSHTKLRGIVTLCGSTRFKEEYETVNRILELNDWIVLTVASYYHSEKDASLRKWIERNKVKLDKLHLA